MAELAVAALGLAIEVAKLIAKPIIRQFNYLCCFTSNINSLKEEAQSLDDALAGLEGEVEVARDNVLDPVPQVETWLAESKKMKDEISGILNEASNVGSGCCLKLGARSLSRRAKKTTESTEKLRGEKPTAAFLPRPKAAGVGVQLGKTFECESRNKIEEDIMTALRGGDEKNMIGICGMGGLGKTTMAKKLMNRALNEHVFDEVVIATISQKVDISKIQDEIGGQLGLEKLKEEKSESARVQLLLSRLSDTKRTTLLVLDDVWETPPLESIGIPRDSKGCTILFTSRNRDVLHAMDGVQIFGMKVLSEDEAWSFFRERAGACADDRELNPIAKQVAKECGGLPINLAAVGAGLKDKRIQRIWNNTLRKLKKSIPDNVRYDKNNYNPLKLSYEYLDSKEAQSIFLLCCLFPEDADIPLEYLTYFCMGLRIFEDDITNMQQARDLMLAETEFIKDRSLLLESDKEDCVRMHDVVRDVCTLIAKEEGYIGKDGSTWISSSHLLSGSRCPKLRLLLLDRRYDSLGFKFDDAFVEGMTELNVLCVKKYHSLTTLPHPTQSLGNLNTLILDSCDKLETISVVGELVNLEILICRDCESIEKLPSEMKILKSLKVLELTKCFKLQSIGRGIISSLVGLEEMKMHGSFKRWEERENASIKERGTFLEPTEKKIEYRDFVNKELVYYFIKDHERSIPYVVDGLNSGQREILLYLFKEKSADMIRVEEMCAYLSRFSPFYHKEKERLENTTIGMAQDFVGCNNINLLLPNSRFGSRCEGGEDHEEPMYLSTQLSPMVRFLFPTEDDISLTYLNEVEQSNEVRQSVLLNWYVPIIPMVLVNGSEGTGSLWSSSVPNYNPLDIIANLKQLLKGGEPKMVAMQPWYKGFTGSIEKNTTEDSYTISGNFVQLDEETFVITELSIGMWTDDYDIRFRHENLTDNFGCQEFCNNSEGDIVDFLVCMSKKEVSAVKNEGLLKTLKLTTCVGTSNMHLFDSTGVIKKYENPEEILQEFFCTRLKIFWLRYFIYMFFWLKSYEQRKEFVSKEILKCENKCRYIKCVVDGSIILGDRERADLLHELKTKGFDSFAGKENISVEISSDYDYLLSLEIGTFALENLQAEKVNLEKVFVDERFGKL